VTTDVTRQTHKTVNTQSDSTYLYVPFGVTYDKIGTIQRRLAWPLHKDDTLVQSGSATADNIFMLLISIKDLVTKLAKWDVGVHLFQDVGSVHLYLSKSPYFS
jgi:hypothetical protein